ncbi:unnamed protein product [Rangifer tarandus platyrhynchus]|uniref:Uncharacterized protein n=2 Tax=Rangifer tarandus platyrhynchus TaxID=3082113 RepID=A0AC59Z4I6_RANTA|nr:unnamed protein product [Rangifer tarandus platyrhynchus]
MEGQKTTSLQKRLTADGLLVLASVLPAPSCVSQPAPPLLLTLMLSLHLCVEQCSSPFSTPFIRGNLYTARRPINTFHQMKTVLFFIIIIVIIVNSSCICNRQKQQEMTQILSNG